MPSGLRVMEITRPLLLGAVAVLLGAFFLSAPAAAFLLELIWSKFLPPICAAALIVGASCAVGDWAMRALRVAPQRGPTRVVCGLCVGSALLSIATLLAGLCGIMHRWLIAAVLMLLTLTWLRGIWRSRASAVGAQAGGEVHPAFGPGSCVVLWSCFTALFLALNLVSAFLPPSEYDVLEYHLAAPAEYHRLGRVVFLKDNVYSNFPSNAEMTYLLGMILTGDRLSGAYAGKIVNVLYGLVIAAFVAFASKHIFSSPARWEPFLAVYSCPCILVAGMLAHVTMALMLYMAFALYALLQWQRAKDPVKAGRWLVLAGIGVGAAMGTKYTGFVFALVPAALAAALCVRGCLAVRVKRLARVVIPALVLVSPWLVRNWANTGNPTYPLLYRVFGSSNWSALKDARFAKAHSPQDATLAGLLTRTRDFLTNTHRVYLSAALVLLALLAFTSWRAPEHWPAVGLLTGVWLLMLLSWYYLTHQIDRFLVPSAVALGFLSAAGASSMARSRAGIASLRVLVAVSCGFSLVQNLWLAHNTGVFEGAFVLAGRSEEGREFMRGHTDFAEVWEAFEFVDENLPLESKLLFVGEARAFYCPRDAWVGTVFDDAPLEVVLASGSVSEALAKMRAAGVTHVLFNWREVRRLSTTYSFEHEGRVLPGYLPMSAKQQHILMELKQKHFKLVKAVGKQYDSGERHVELYEVVYGSAP